MTFLMRNGLRQMVEAASGGQATVVFSKRGQPIYLRRVDKFRVEQMDPNLGTGVHPAFIVNGREISEFWVGIYPGYVHEGEILSYPGLAPSVLTYDSAVAAARNTGPGFHIITNAEWAAIALYAIHAIGGGSDPVHGPDPYGVSTGNPKQYGRRVDGKAPGDTSSISFTIGGSGPLQWRHDQTEWGIADLVQGISPGTLVGGLLLRNGEINVIPNNDAALASTDLSPSSPAWKAIMPDGTLVAPGTAGTLKYDIPPTASYSNDNVVHKLGVPYLRTQRKTPPWPEEEHQDEAYTYAGLSALQKDPGTLSVPSLLHQLLLFPHVTTLTRGAILVRPYGIRQVARGWEGLSGLHAGSLYPSAALLRIAYIPV